VRAASCFVIFAYVHPWRVELQSMEPESIILSIELRVRIDQIPFCAAKVVLSRE
jgi:hypothetical protein